MSLNIDGTYGSSMISVSGSLSFYNKNSCCDSCEESSNCDTTVESSMCVDTVNVHFDQFATGDTVLSFPGFLLSTNNPTNPLMIFNSAVPTIGQEALGTPNSTLGGPGIGIAGQAGQPGENSIQQYKTLIISANPPTPLTPVPNATGGVITLNFYEDVSIREVHLLNVQLPCTQLQAYDFNNNIVSNKYAEPLGPNSFQKVIYDCENACSPKKAVRKLVITLKNDVAICNIIYDQCQNPALPAVTKVCENWDTFVIGSTNVTFTGGSVTSNNPGTNPAMIFNSTVPTAGQFQLGTPNNMALPPGAGIGLGGQPGQPGENLIDLSNVLIVSADANTLIPNSASGQLLFTFTDPVLMQEVDFLNVDTAGTTIQLYDAGFVPIDLINVPVLGVNSFQKIETTLPYLTKYMTITLTSTTAVSKICYSLCTCSGGGGGGLPAPDLILLPDNAMTLIDIPSTGFQGSYSLVVKSVNADGAAAVFSASSGFNTQAGSIARLTSAPALTDEMINIQWLPNNKVQLYHCTVKTGGVGALIPYYVRVLTV